MTGGGCRLRNDDERRLHYTNHMPLLPRPPHSVKTPLGPVRYYKAGSGPPLLLLHGLGGSAVVWHRALPLLAKRCTVYAIELWDTERHAPSHRYTPADGVSLLTAFMDAVQCAPAHLCGSSLGGLIAGFTALEHPDRVRSLTMAAAAGLGREAALFLRFITLPLIGELLFRPSRRRIARLVRILTLRSASQDASLIDALYAERLKPGVPSQMLRVLRSGIGPLGAREEVSLAPRLPDIQVPALVLWGENDPLFPATQGRRAAERLPNARLHVFPQAGHWPYLEYPEDFAKALNSFVAECDTLRQPP